MEGEGIRASETFPATSEGLAAATAFLDGVCPNPRISVVFDELASNVVRCSGASHFNVSVVRAGNIVLEIADDGKPFDPTSVAEPDVTASASEREIGGLGLLMVRKMSKRFAYRRAGDRNVVTVEM